MRYPTLVALALSAGRLFAQDPEIGSWILNPGNETGYGGYLTNVQTVYYTATDVYVSCTCIPGYDIGPWTGNPNVPANQDFTFKLTRNPVENTGTPTATGLGHTGVLRNGVSIFNAKDAMSYNNQGIWERNAYFFEGSGFDECLGHPAPNGEYHNHVTPNCVYDHLDNEHHSDLIGYAFDGFPIYGAYGYVNTDGTGGIARMRSSFRLRNITDRTTLPDGTVLQANQYGPAINTTYPLGAFIQDFEYAEGSGDLDAHNGRFCITPEFPDGHYVYFVTLDENSDPAYPYIIGPDYYGTVQAGNTGPQSGHNTIPNDAVLYDPNATGIAEAASIAEDAFSLYPVPVQDVLGIRTDGTSLSGLRVLDAQGRVVRTEAVTGVQVTVDLSALMAGMYHAQMLFNDGRAVVRPFVKQ